jgi:hypothetical protein
MMENCFDRSQPGFVSFEKIIARVRQAYYASGEAKEFGGAR